MDRQQNVQLIETNNESAQGTEAAFAFLSESQLVLVGGGIGDTVL